MGPGGEGGGSRTRRRPRPGAWPASITPPLGPTRPAAPAIAPLLSPPAGRSAVDSNHGAAAEGAAAGSDRRPISRRLRTRIRPGEAAPPSPGRIEDGRMRPKRRSQSTFGGMLALLVPALLATVVLSPVRPVAAQAMWSMGSDEVSGSRATVDNLGKTEGCFNKFEPLLSKVYNAVELDNRVCQVWCASQRMSVSATSLSTCYCGNIYPSAYFRVKDDFCDNPCSPDKQYCYVNACCGSKDGRYFTVAFAGQLDPVLQLLRQLTYDYRTNNPKLRAHVKELMGASAPLQVMSSHGGFRTGVVMSGGAGIGLQGSCPEHYSEFQGACYARIFGDMMSFAQADARCAKDGATLATLQSPAENNYVASMLYQRPGWIGLSNRDVGRFQWDDWTNWGAGEPTANGVFLTTMGPTGTASGDAFNDQNVNVRNIRQLAVYASSRVLGVQAKYLYRNGSEVIGNVMGTNKGGNTAVISLTYGQYVSGAFGELVNGAIQSLSIVIKDVKGNAFTYGPYGTTGTSGAKPWSLTATSLITGFFGTASAQGINSLGFYDLQTPRCTQITPSGTWRVVPCQQAFDGVSYACQLRPTASAVDCPSGGWFRYGSLCYKAFSGNKLSWEAARQSCLTMQATLVTVSTPEMNAFLQSRFQGGFGYIGLKDRVPVGQTNRSFVWEGYTNWAPGQPTPLPSSRTASAFAGGCVAMDANQLWSVIDCDDTSGARATVCEVGPTDTSCTCPGGWTPFGCRCYRVVVPDSSGQTGVFGAGVSWLSASTACAQLGGKLLDVNSPGESSYIATRLAKGQGVFLGRRDVFNAGVYSAETYTNWAAGEPIDNLGTVNGGGGGLCGVIRGDGQWYGFPCTSSFNQAVCKRPKAAPVGGTSGRGEEFTMIALDPTVEPRWGQPLDVYLKHTATGAYLGVDSVGNLFTSTTQTPDAQLTVMSVTNTTGFTIRSKQYDFYLRLDPDEGRLATVDSYGDSLRYLSAESVWVREPKEAEAGAAEEEAIREDEENVGVFGKRSTRKRRRAAAGPPTRAPTAAPAPAPIGPSIFTSMQSFGPISLQNLQIGLAVQRSDSMPHPRYCSLKVYDLTATSDSFSCYYIEGDASGLPMVELEVDAFTIQDKTTILNPRTPLQNGRTKCENESPTDTLTCTFAYGEGLTFSKALAVQFGHNYANQFQLEHQATDYSSVWYNWLQAFDNQYISITTNTYVESRNWAVNVPVPPLTVCTMQFWLSSVALNYVWQAILKATGGFDLSANGVYFGSNYALSDISNPWDLRVYQWGRYSAPTQAEVIITTDELQASKYNLQPPSMSNV